jgi:hypothetical protein
MTLLFVLRSMLLVAPLLMAPLLDTSPVEAKTRHVRPHPAPASDATESSPYQSAMRECEGYYSGQRFRLGLDRYAYIEGCFRTKTGRYPSELQVNCTLRRC